MNTKHNKMEITKQTIQDLKDGDILEGFLSGIKRSEVIAVSYQISDETATFLKLPKTQFRFKGLTKDGQADMRTKSIDVLDSALTWYLK